MELLLDQARIEAVMLAGVRIVAFLVIAPPFSYRAIPARVKAMLAVSLALAVSPQVAGAWELGGTGRYIGALLLELVVGAALGFLVLVVFSAIQAAGSLIDLFGGFSLSQAFDPQSMVNGAQFTRLFQLTALTLLFTSDGYQLIITGLMRTFSALPLGAGLDLTEPVDALTRAVTGLFLASVQIAGPLIVVLFLADVGLGLLTRVAPALNALALGFPLKIFITLSLVGVVFVALPRVVSTLGDNAVRLVTGVG
ncbi:flagellar biosynthesis protein FliR [Arthrobacter sp. RIT-PI-e]|uniref:flagellar biosynthetic protein FliR n=1 Tax=Arthrobacter sp. RIT-PI-e TaxID=1681197 RepID=UPI000675C45F|nr:flagellar biosynthetic protein FliR [Arthrobacter sp. RIT-PI-e]KNC17346.1 flagellar biosynthesis protein FliR [Arthrobacter sp. RIT-PI-e]